MTYTVQCPAKIGLQVTLNIYIKGNESGFRPPLCTYRLNWARGISWGWWNDWDDTVLQTQDSKFEPWWSEAEHAISRSRRLPTILTFTRGWGRNDVKGSGANHYPRAPALNTYIIDQLTLERCHSFCILWQLPEVIYGLPCLRLLIYLLYVTSSAFVLYTWVIKNRAYSCYRLSINHWFHFIHK